MSRDCAEYVAQVVADAPDEFTPAQEAVLAAAGTRPVVVTT